MGKATGKVITARRSETFLRRWSKYGYPPSVCPRAVFSAPIPRLAAPIRWIRNQGKPSLNSDMLALPVSPISLLRIQNAVTAAFQLWMDPERGNRSQSAFWAL
jgi:hypothetical protein